MTLGAGTAPTRSRASLRTSVLRSNFFGLRNAGHSGNNCFRNSRSFKIG
jgi:hypothetical protein